MRASVARTLLSAPAADALQARGQECPRYTIRGGQITTRNFGVGAALGPFTPLLQCEGHFECPVQFLNLGAGQRSNEAGQLHLAETYEVVAQDPAFMFQALVDTDRDLRGKPVSAGEYRCADDGGESRINQDLAAYDDEAAIKFGIVSARRTARLMYAIDFASSHVLIFTSLLFTSAAGLLLPYFSRQLCVRVLIAKNVLHFNIEFIGSLIDELEIASFDLRPRAFAQVLSEYGFDKSGARLLRPRNAIDPGEHLFR